MNGEIQFSIIIPVYNVEKYLDECVSSVLSQSYENYEVILVDDGSTDSSGNLCDMWAEKSSRIVVIHQKNGGLSAARNTGIQNAQGDYVMFLDSDDYWSGDTTLSRIADRLRLSNADVLSFNYVKVYGSTRSAPYFKHTGDMPAELWEKQSFSFLCENDLWIASAWNKVIQRKLFADHNLRFKLGITSEDIDWCVRLALQGERFDFISEVLLCYRQRVGSISSELSAEKLINLCSNVDKCLDLLNTNPGTSAEQLKPYVAYQYATFVYGVAQAEFSVQRQLLPKVVQNKTVLKWSDNRKVRLIRCSVRFMGIRGTMFLLKVKAKLTQWGNQQWRR